MALDSAEPVVGSFTADGLTFALSDDGVTLVSVSPDAVKASGPDGGRGEVGTSEPSAPSGLLAVPSTASCAGVTYDVTTIGPYAFYLSGATDVALPASIVSVDERAFRSSDVERVEVAPDNPTYASFDGCLYGSQLTRLLLIPGGRKGAVRIPDKAEGVDASAFSHCAGVDAILVDAGSAHLSSWDGLLYDASGTTLLRVPAGATEITIRDGCTTIAAGAMAGCAKLERINAPASVTSISPDVFESVPTVALPAQSALQGEATSGVASTLVDQAKEPADPAPQLTAMVALSTAADPVPQVDPAAITAIVPEGADVRLWEQFKMTVLRWQAPQIDSMATSDLSEDSLAKGNGSGEDVPIAGFQTASTYAAAGYAYAFTPTQRYAKETMGGTTDSSWKMSSGKPGVWAGPSAITVTSYRFYNGLFYRRGPWSGTANAYTYRFASSSSGGTWNHCKVGRSTTGPWTTLSSSSSWTSNSGDLYIVAWNNPFSVTLNKQGGSGGTASPVSVDPCDPMPTLTKPSLSGWTFSGYVDSLSSTLPRLYVKADGTASATSRTIEANRTLQAAWTKTVTFSANGGTQGSLKSLTALKGQPLGRTCSQVSSSNADYPIRSLFATSLKPDDGWAPTRVGYVFDGFWSTSASSGGTQWVDKDGNLKVSTCDTSTPSTLYARWIPKQITVDPNGGTVSTSDGDQSTEPMTAQWTNSWSAFGPPSGNSSRIYYYDMSQILKWMRVARPGYAFAGWDGIELDSEGAATSSSFGPQTTFKALWTARDITVTWDANDDDALIRIGEPPAKPVISGTVTRAYDPSKTLIRAFDTPSIVLSPSGFAFSGWFKHQTEEGDLLTESTPFPTANVTYYAHWTPVVSADVPLEVTAKVDMLGVEEQAPASGYIESRSGAALEVAQVDFEPLAGAADLFGADVAAVYLEALAAGSTAADYRFALDAAATEADADKLAPFALPDGYGSRVPISYRFDIPKALLPSLTETTKPVCQVIYTVALA